MGNKASRRRNAEDPNAAGAPKTDANANAAQNAPSSKEDANAQPATVSRASRRSVSSAQNQQKLIAAHKRIENNINQRRILKELSVAPIDRVTQRRMTMGDRLTRTHGTRMAPEESAEARHAYAEKMKQNSPFHKRWNVMDTLSEGSFGVVFTVQDLKTKTMGVIKVARQLGNNKIGDWESHVPCTMFKRNPNASVVRLLDKGMLAQDGGTNFMVMERIECNVKDWLHGKPPEERKVAACKVALEMLKGIYDLHMEGYLHRDLKPPNMGILSAQKPVLLIYDLGMAKMYTDSGGKLRPLRTTCYMRGTPEWASPRTMKSREQTRFDDLIAWLFVIIELFHPNKATEQALPWSNRLARNAVRYLRSEHFPARLLIRSAHIPAQFYSIHTYLRTANPNKAPNYEFIAELVSEAREECNAAPSKEHVNSVRVIDKGSNDAAVNPRKCSRNRIATKTATRK